MQTPFMLRLLLLPVVLFVSACGSLPQQSSSIKTQAVANNNIIVSKASVGTRMSLPAGNELGVSSVLVVDEYLAASGRLCRLVEVEPSSEDTRVMCQRVSGEWSFTRALISSAFRQQINPRALAASPLVKDLPKSESGDLGRTTQQSDKSPVKASLNAESWLRIAQLDGISVVDELAAESLVNAPAERIETDR